MRRPTGTREALGLSPLVKTRGTAPSVSNVFHSLPHAQDHRSFLRGDQPQSGHRMRGPDGSRFFSRSGSRSKTTDESSERGPYTSRYDELVRHANASRRSEERRVGKE